MRIFLIFKLLILAVLTCIMGLIMMPALLLGGTQFIREVYSVVEREVIQVRKAFLS
ncbi:MAG: hypothetical protein K6U11_08900 [bacterium]|nr:hypothetical protein [bacterium]